ncbi:acetyl-CoA acetyltransferase, partial [Streptomyces muensis]|nr:acetyl-CoA acetyltransferase [Streptomyces muensis]
PGRRARRTARPVHGGLPRLGVASATGGWFCSSGTVVLGRD